MLHKLKNFINYVPETDCKITRNKLHEKMLIISILGKIVSEGEFREKPEIRIYALHPFSPTLNYWP